MLSWRMFCRQDGVWMEQQLSGLPGEASFLQHVHPAACGDAVSGSAGNQAPLEAPQSRAAAARVPGHQCLSV